MKTIQVFLFSLVLSAACMAQASQVDGLVSKIRGVTNKPDSIDFYAEKLLRLNSNRAKAEGYFAKGFAEYQRGNLQNAISWYDKAVTTGSQRYLFNLRLLQNKGHTLERLGEHEAANSVFLELLKLATEEGDLDARITALQNLGVSSRNNSETEKSIQFLKEALIITPDEHISKYHIHAELAISQLSNQEPQLAVKNYERAIQIAKSKALLSRMEEMEAGLVDAYIQAGLQEKNEEYLRTLISTEKDTLEIISRLRSIAKTLSSREQYEESISLLQRANYLSVLSGSAMSGALYLEMAIASAKMDQLTEAILFCDSSFYHLIEKEAYSQARAVAGRAVSYHRKNGDQDVSDQWQSIADYLKNDQPLKKSDIYNKMREAGLNVYFLESERGGVNPVVMVVVALLGALVGTWFYRKRSK